MRDGARPVSTTGCYLLSVIAQGIGGFQAGGFAGRIPSGKADDERQDQPSQQGVDQEAAYFGFYQAGRHQVNPGQIHANQQGRDGGDRQQHQALPHHQAQDGGTRGTHRHTQAQLRTAAAHVKPERADHREEHVREQEQAQSGDDPLGVTLDRVLQIRGSHVGVGSHLRHPEVTHHQLTLHRFQEPIGVTGRSHGRAKAEGYLHLCKIVKLPQVEQGEEDTLLPAVELVIADRPCHRHHVSGKGITMQVDIGPDSVGRAI